MFNLMVLFFIFINFLFKIFQHPLILSLMLFMKTCLICLLISMISPNSWFAYILFLVFIGGILILFLYIISLINNEKFLLIKNYSMMNWLMIFIAIYLIMMKFHLNINNLDMMNYYNNNFLEMNLNKLFNFPTNIINMFLMFYLFFMLIITTKIINLFLGPLRLK